MRYCDTFYVSMVNTVTVNSPLREFHDETNITESCIHVCTLLEILVCQGSWSDLNMVCFLDVRQTVKGEGLDWHPHQYVYIYIYII